MKVLQLCHKVPFPPKDGGCIAMNNLTEGLINEGCSVKVLAINTKKHFVDINLLPATYRSKTNIETVLVNTEVNVVDAISNLFSTKSYNIERFYSSDFEKKLIEILAHNSYDVVQLESLYVSMYVDVIRKHSSAKIVLRSHNIEHKLWEYNAQLASNSTKKKYFKLLAKRLKEYELKSMETFDAVLSITSDDEAYFKGRGYSKPMLTVPFGVNIDDYAPGKNTDSAITSVFHIGAMDWQHNIEGVNWLLKNVWEKVSEKHPELEFYLAGRGMSAQLKRLKRPNVNVVGEVEDALDFMLSNGLMLVPLLSGGGMRVKIIEGMALGKTIISTTIGAEGIAYEKDKNIIIADTLDEFVAAIDRCINDKSYAANIGVNARKLVESEYSNRIICRNVKQFYQTIIA